MLVVLLGWATFHVLGPAGFAYTAALRCVGLPGSANGLAVGTFVAWCLLRTYHAGACAWAVALSAPALDVQLAALATCAAALSLLRWPVSRGAPLSALATVFLLSLVALPLATDEPGARRAAPTRALGGARRPAGAPVVLLSGTWEARAWAPGEAAPLLLGSQRMQVWSDGSVEGEGSHAPAPRPGLPGTVRRAAPPTRVAPPRPI